MPATATVTSKGQITVPVEIRKRLGLREGDQIEFVPEGGAIVIRPARGEPNPFEAYIGALGAFPGGTDGINEWVRELRDEE